MRSQPQLGKKGLRPQGIARGPRTRRTGRTPINGKLQDSQLDGQSVVTRGAMRPHPLQRRGVTGRLRPRLQLRGISYNSRQLPGLRRARECTQIDCVVLALGVPG
ncbi:hypothetical protein NDU88_003119 [Pleurodeles waltl]|uniref:Uncharacterized protein n=1 Tax=Pleurodeles waltl TaxID=8319 RepID=A0AAV7UB90_PLEWA|nr:hypothetical protein NDU88_003119 [Pleurodeles waltl]